MDFTTLLESMQSALGDYLPSILGALAILVLGWFVAVLVRAGLRRGLRMLSLNKRLESAIERPLDVEGGASKIVYYLILLMALIGFFNALDLALVSEPLQALVNEVMGFLPRIAGGGVLALVAWLLATLLKKLAIRGLAATKLDEKVSREAGMKPVSDSLGNVLYWLVILIFLPAILGTLGLGGLLVPVQEMVNEILAVVPNIFAAAVIGVVGWFIARLLRDIVGNLLSAAGADELGRKAGLTGKLTGSRMIGLVVYILVLVPALIAALEALKIEAISAPATEMLSRLMAAIPEVFAATVILGLTWFVARFVAEIVVSLLEGVGFDRLPEKIGLRHGVPGESSLSRLVGRVVVIAAMVFATVEAANRLELTQVADLVATFIGFGGQVLLGVAIIVIGLWLSSVAHAAIGRFDAANAAFFAGLARFAILGLILAMGLRAMGIADDIVNLAFGLTLGSIAVAFALSFGLGGREPAGKQMEIWLSRLRRD